MHFDRRDCSWLLKLWYNNRITLPHFTTRQISLNTGSNYWFSQNLPLGVVIDFLFTSCQNQKNHLQLILLGMLVWVTSNYNAQPLIIWHVHIYSHFYRNVIVGKSCVQNRHPWADEANHAMSVHGHNFLHVLIFWCTFCTWLSQY